jgi:hypothetical protein
VTLCYSYHAPLNTEKHHAELLQGSHTTQSVVVEHSKESQARLDTRVQCFTLVLTESTVHHLNLAYDLG